MALFDMPLNKMMQYQGSTPCPKDFDEYWDNALKEIENLDYNIELIKSDYKSKSAVFYDLYFTGTRNARIHTRFAVPKNIDGKVPAVLRFHGLSDNACQWSDFLKYTAEGYCAASLDVRGQGGTSQDVGGNKGTTYTTPFIRGLDGDKNDLFMRDVYLDTVILAKLVMNFDFVDEKRIGVTGGSQGGGLSIVCAALVPEVKKCAVCYPYLSDFKRVWDLDLCRDAYEGIKYYFRKYDPTHERENEIFERLGYIDIQNFAKRVKAEVLMSTGLMDTVVPPSTQFAMYNKLTCTKKYKIYYEYGHEALYGNDDVFMTFYSDL